MNYKKQWVDYPACRLGYMQARLLFVVHYKKVSYFIVHWLQIANVWRNWLFYCTVIILIHPCMKKHCHVEAFYGRKQWAENIQCQCMITAQHSSNLLTCMIRWAHHYDEQWLYLLYLKSLYPFPCVQGFGRKKCFDERRQHNSHFYLCHYDDALSPVSTAKCDHSAYQTDFLPKQETEGREATLGRRFPRDHSARSQMNATAQAGECFMWFGRDDSNQNTPLSVLAVTNLSLTS